MQLTTLDGLVSRQKPGFALERPFYTDPQLFEHEMDRIMMRHWFCVGHVSSIPRAGDFRVIELGSESVIVVRDQHDEIHALLNVCRHRGSRICAGRSGRASNGRFTCPYHAWTYDLGGNLLVAREMPDSFERNQFGLKVLAVRVSNGLIFSTFAREPLDFAAADTALAQTAGVHGWPEARVAHSEMFSINANWKLAVENYMECYHCQPAHAEFTRRHVYARPAAQVELSEADGRRRAAALGILINDVDLYGSAAPQGTEFVSVFRSALQDGVVSATRDNQPISRLMGQFSAYDGNSTYFDVGPFSDFLAYPDHGVIYRFIPRSVTLTEMEVLWLVHQDAVDGRDYDLERLTWLWKVTSLEDKKIVEANQAGISSRLFEPGPYSQQEPYARRFVEWYLQELASRHA